MVDRHSQGTPLRRGFRFLVLVCAAVTAGSIASLGYAQDGVGGQPPLRAPDVRYEPTPMDVAGVMLRLADVKPGDAVYDLGCGDGRIVIAAVRQYNARGVCVDIDPRRIAESRENAREAGVADRILFLNQDLLAADISGATVVMLFLSPELNLKLRPKLLRELRPGTRIVSHWHDMGDWRPQKTMRVRSGGYERHVYLWVVPARKI
jgi:SAM-dependent methyltransferase